MEEKVNVLHFFPFASSDESEEFEEAGEEEKQDVRSDPDFPDSPVSFPASWAQAMMEDNLRSLFREAWQFLRGTPPSTPETS